MFDLKSPSEHPEKKNEKKESLFYMINLVINLWNSVPAERIDFSSLSCFKR